jgi:hypothetical protein
MLACGLGLLLAMQLPPDANSTAGPAPAVSQPAAGPGFIPDEAALKVPPPQQRLVYSVVIENRSGGLIRVIDPPAQFLLARPGVDIGTVVRPATMLNTESFHASLWGGPGTVVASAVNAVHIKAYDQPGLPRAAVITLLPSQLLSHELDGSQARLRDDQIYTDIPGGHGIFGGAYPVIAGNPARVYRNMRRVEFSPGNTSLRQGDVIIIQVQAPLEWPRMLTVQNAPGGKVTMRDAGGADVECGSVEKPVTGTGRFSGGAFCAAGGIRATHTGVLDIDFSPQGLLGGLQLIPHAHSLSPELTYSQESPPYGILLGPGGSDLRGQAPVYSGYIYPQSGLEEPKLLPHLRVSVQFEDYTRRGGTAVEVEPGPVPWVTLPSLSGREDLSDLRAIRIEWLPQAAHKPAPTSAAPPSPTAAEAVPPVNPTLRRHKLPRSFRPKSGQ